MDSTGDAKGLRRRPDEPACAVFVDKSGLAHCGPWRRDRLHGKVEVSKVLPPEDCDWGRFGGGAWRRVGAWVDGEFVEW